MEETPKDIVLYGRKKGYPDSLVLYVVSTLWKRRKKKKQMAVPAAQVPTPIALPVFDDSFKLRRVEVQGCGTLPPQDLELLTFLLRKQPSGVVITHGLAFQGNSLHLHVFDFVRCLHANLSDTSWEKMFTSMRWRCKADPQSVCHEGPPLSIGYLSAISAIDAACFGNASPCCVCKEKPNNHDVRTESWWRAYFETFDSSNKITSQANWCAWRAKHVAECDGAILQLGLVESCSVQVPECAYFFCLFYHALLALHAVGRGLIGKALTGIRSFDTVWDADVQEVYSPQPSAAPSLVAAQPAAAARLCDLFYIFRCFVELKSAELARVLTASDPLLVEVRQLWSCSNQDVYSMARSVCSVAQRLQSRGSVSRSTPWPTQWRDNMVAALRNAADDAVQACALPLCRMLRTLPAQCASVDDSACTGALTMLAAKLNSLADVLEQSTFEHGGGAGAYCRYDSWQRSLCTYFLDASSGAQCVAAVYLYTLAEPPLYDMLNKALRENDAKTLSALKPLNDHLEEFLRTMPCRPLVVCRGQTYQIIEMLSQQRTVCLADVHLHNYRPRQSLRSLPWRRHVSWHIPGLHPQQSCVHCTILRLPFGERGADPSRRSVSCVVPCGPLGISPSWIRSSTLRCCKTVPPRATILPQRPV